MKTIESNGKKLMLVEVPMEAEHFNLGVPGELQYMIESVNGVTIGDFAIPNSDYDLIGTITNGEIDFDARLFVKCDIIENNLRYWNYETSGFIFALSKTSFLSLLKKSGIEVKDKKFIILKLK